MTHDLILIIFSLLSESCFASSALIHPQTMPRTNIGLSKNPQTTETCLSSPLSLSETLTSDQHPRSDVVFSPVPYQRGVNLADDDEPSEVDFRGGFQKQTPGSFSRQESKIVCEPHIEEGDSTECLSETIELELKVQQSVCSKPSRPVTFRLRKHTHYREVTMVASWSGWKEHTVLFHRNKFGSDVDIRPLDGDCPSFVELNLPNGTHHFKVSL